jgi:undecaprenyl-diphosphatase
VTSPAQPFAAPATPGAGAPIAERPTALLRARPVVTALAGGALALTVLAGLTHGLLLAVDEPIADVVRAQSWLEVLRPLNELGSERQGAVLAVVAGLALWRWCRRMAWLVPAVVGAGIALNVGMKLLVDRPRPPDPLGATALASFPSGHVLHAVVLLGLVPPLVHLVTRRRWAFWASAGVVAALAVCVAAMRVYLGAHWPTDVVASLLIGALLLAATEGALQGGPACTSRACALHQPSGPRLELASA